ncbi:MAG TPA: DNA-processing protein DprA [Hyalangium sp.]|nr:DNA-processing protein DprA [Hyalangium sp.]
MTLDHAVALSFIDGLPRVGLTDRLFCNDPELLDLAAAGLPRARDLRLAAAERQIGVIAWNDPRFPAGLLMMGDCPPALWFRGDLAVFDAPAVAVVGSRAASAPALAAASSIGEGLAVHGVAVVSGLARGVDSAAHRGALRRGKTIAVLGSGVDRIYPVEHHGLASDIAARGLVLSEFPPGTAPLPFRFPLRNRIISGLSRAVVVIEASEKSGSLITAGCALEQGREVMAVPGNVLSGRNSGGHALLRDGARLVETADDVLADLGLAPRAGDVRAATDVKSTNCADPVLGSMDAGQPYDLDTLAHASGLQARQLLPHLSELELRGLVTRLEGGRFMRSA